MPVGGLSESPVPGFIVTENKGVIVKANPMPLVSATRRRMPRGDSGTAVDSFKRALKAARVAPALPACRLPMLTS
jgi:hypothetical protein